MKTFKDVKIGQTFYAASGRPSKKISENTAVSLVPELTGHDYQSAIEDVKHRHSPNDSVYRIGEAKGYRL
jgi:hypothetical protein